MKPEVKAIRGFPALLAAALLSATVIVPACAQTLTPSGTAPSAPPTSSFTAPKPALMTGPVPSSMMEPAPANLSSGSGMAAPAAEPTGTNPHNLIAYSSATVDGPYIAITFDDGPNPETTPRLLKMLEQRGIKATFFVLGSRAVASPNIIKQMIAQGHEVANHSWDHPQLPKIPVAAADKQIGDTNAAIEQITGLKIHNVRPPYGAMTPALRAHLREKFGSTFIYWSVDPLDWKDRNPTVIHDRIVSHVHPGAIILAHDIHPTTVDAMPKTLDDLLAKGYKFVTVSQLIAMNKAMPEPKVASLNPAPKKKPKVQGTAAAANTTGSTGAKPASTAPKPVTAKPASTKPASTAPRPPASVGLY
ncbi:peptidoglycan/xylan/chitin deacetylase (PgdA/CDA1 family) [Xanthobacter flavus]|uniref:Chitooligosaccharide deacetylase n=2 Tax=Xanthobacter flavus TaxID=281 RepID=A0ABU1KIS4_XANFL|nr:polysaccharide deacetylase family protein [Xanthobacter flavus]MBN8917721.1 polysaccharide deacetylase family protein [Hyphomicrobiales bacterium]MDR6334738.1 peptidoglycan/xylan/chitin deacetylase (PgdA/CDA1 family) [Xanthobacter flavus]